MVIARFIRSFSLAHSRGETCAPHPFWSRSEAACHGPKCLADALAGLDWGHGFTNTPAASKLAVQRSVGSRSAARGSRGCAARKKNRIPAAPMRTAPLVVRSIPARGEAGRVDYCRGELNGGEHDWNRGFVWHAGLGRRRAV